MATNQPIDPKKKKSDARYTRDADKFRLYAEAMGQCCFDGCSRCLVITEGETLNSAQLCHMRGREADAARHDPCFLEGIDDYGNLIVMCYEHHHLIDDEVTRSKFSVQDLEKMKARRASAWSSVLRQSAVLGHRFELIDDICDRLLVGAQPVFGKDLDNVDITRKVKVNDLDPRSHNVIIMGLLWRSQVSDAIAGLSAVNARAPHALKNKIKSLYLELSADLEDGNSILMAMMAMISDRHDRVKGGDDYWPAAAAVVAYFFEACDILERE